MISVIIPYYNPDADVHLEKLLERAVTSAERQSGKGLEVQTIIVDDGSPVPPHAVADRHPGVILKEAVHGRLGAARNRGLEIADGDLIAFLDADDYYFPDSLRQCADAIRKYDADLLSFNLTECSEEGLAQHRTTEPVFEEPVNGRTYMEHYTPFGSSCRYLIKRSLLERYGLRFAENIYMEDEDFTPRLLFYSERFVVSDAAVYAYCRRNGSITMSGEYEERSTSTITVLGRLVDFASTQPAGQRGGLERKIRFLAMDHIRNTLRRPDWKNAIGVQTAILSSIGLWPLKDAGYGTKFKLFSYLSRCDAGIRLLHLNELRYK